MNDTSRRRDRDKRRVHEYDSEHSEQVREYEDGRYRNNTSTWTRNIVTSTWTIQKQYEYMDEEHSDEYMDDTETIRVHGRGT
jgi:hypothetical protein